MAGTQGVQASAPAVGLNVPAGHGMHVTVAVRGEACGNVPAGQAGGGELDTEAPGAEVAWMLGRSDGNTVGADGAGEAPGGGGAGLLASTDCVAAAGPRGASFVASADGVLAAEPGAGGFVASDDGDASFDPEKGASFVASADGVLNAEPGAGGFVASNDGEVRIDPEKGANIV